MLFVALVISRIVTEPGSSMPHASDEAVLLVKRDAGCQPADAGVPADAGPADAGVADDAGVDCSGTITLIVQPRFTIGTGGARFAVLLVTPSPPVVDTARDSLFEELRVVTAPFITTHDIEVEDPSLGTRCVYDSGCGSYAESGSYPDPLPWDPPTTSDAHVGDGGIAIETVGPYEIVQARPVDAPALETWLTQLGYVYAQTDVDAIAPYLARGYTVVAARLAVGGPLDGALVPLALTWAGRELRLPVTLGAELGQAAEPLTVYVAAATRYEMPDAPIRFARMTSVTDPGFLTRADVTVDSTGSPDDDPVALPAFGPEYQEQLVVDQKVLVPVTDCSGGDRPIGCCNECNTGNERIRIDLVLVVIASAFVLRRRRRRR